MRCGFANLIHDHAVSPACCCCRYGAFRAIRVFLSTSRRPRPLPQLVDQAARTEAAASREPRSSPNSRPSARLCSSALRTAASSSDTLVSETLAALGLWGAPPPEGHVEALIRAPEAPTDGCVRVMDGSAQPPRPAIATEEDAQSDKARTLAAFRAAAMPPMLCVHRALHYRCQRAIAKLAVNDRVNTVSTKGAELISSRANESSISSTFTCRAVTCVVEGTLRRRRRVGLHGFHCLSCGLNT